jgi:hypothetical protein
MVSQVYGAVPRERTRTRAPPERFPTEKRAERVPTDYEEGPGLEPIAQFG